MAAYYNEIEPFAAAWLRNLISAGHIAAGDVDERDIRDVRPDDLRGYTQCHFFAGIGGWSLALRLAGWPDERPVWTGSCPCQPFSTAGKNKGVSDDRHLWPRWFPLIRERRPPVVFGEQVPNAVAHGWLDLVFNDLEGTRYACGAGIAPAAGAGAPHIRDRLWFVAADADSEQLRVESGRSSGPDGADTAFAGEHGEPRRAVANGDRSARRSTARHAFGGDGGEEIRRRPEESGRRSGAAALADILSGAQQLGHEWRLPRPGDAAPEHGCDRGASHGGWATEPDVRRVVDGVSGRVAIKRPGVESGSAVQETHWYSRTGALRGFGNAIVPQVAAEFIGAYLDTEHLRLGVFA